MPGNELSDQNPWPGLPAYDERDELFFKGRTAETEEFFRLVRRNVLTVVFGPSGTGKTSLVQAGLFPRLRKESFRYQRLRLDHNRDLIEQVRSALGSGGETLWEGFHRWKGDSGDLPVIVFDQFEEIFTLGAGRPESARFLEELADVVENYFPSSVRQRLERGETLDFGYDREDYRIVLVLREDFVWRLDGLRYRMPNVMRARLVIEPFSETQALEAVEIPGHQVVEHDVAREIVAVATSKRGQRVVDPAILNLLCRELNKRRSGEKISPGQLQGYSEAILSDFWEGSVNTLPVASRKIVREFVEDHLLTPDGFRTAAPRNKLAAHEDAVKKLIEGRVVRNEERFGTPHLELTHDVLCAVIRKSRDERLLRETKAAAAKTRGRLIGVFCAALLCLALAVVSLIMWNRAQRQTRNAQDANVELVKKQHLLEEALRRAKEAEMRESAAEAERDKYIKLAQSKNEALLPLVPVMGAAPQPESQCQALVKRGFRGDARLFSDQDIQQISAQMGVEVAALRAWLEVETSGLGFLLDGRPEILFERHIFSRLTNGKFDDGDISDRKPGGYGALGANQYVRLSKAAGLDCAAALSSTSWGLSQLMGESYRPAGFGDVVRFVEAQTASEADQLLAFAAFSRSSKLISALQAKDWRTFARAYNGPGFAASQYDVKLSAAYQKFASGPPMDWALRAAQYELKRLGLYQGAIDGTGGLQIKSAIQAFQKQHNIAPDGIVGGKTKELLFARKP